VNGPIPRDLKDAGAAQEKFPFLVPSVMSRRIFKKQELTSPEQRDAGSSFLVGLHMSSKATFSVTRSPHAAHHQRAGADPSRRWYNDP